MPANPVLLSQTKWWRSLQTLGQKQHLPSPARPRALAGPGPRNRSQRKCHLGFGQRFQGRRGHLADTSGLASLRHPNIHSASISCHLPCVSPMLKAPAWCHMEDLPSGSLTTCRGLSELPHRTGLSRSRTGKFPCIPNSCRTQPLGNTAFRRDIMSVFHPQCGL